MHPERRAFLLAAAALPLGAAAQQRAALVDPLRVGVDRGLAEAGLATALARAFGRDTGIAAKLSSAPAVQVLDALDRGEIDVSLTDAPAAEDRLLTAGLAHDARTVGQARFALVGPVPPKGQADLLPAGTRDIVAALAVIHAAGAPFLTANDGSAVHLLEQALWREAKLAPAAPWYRPAADAAALLAEARAAGAFAVVEAGLWSRQTGAPFGARVEGDVRLAVPVRVLRAFRSRHPAARIFAEWVGGPKGRAVARGTRGFD